MSLCYIPWNLIQWLFSLQLNYLIPCWQGRATWGLHLGHGRSRKCGWLSAVGGTLPTESLQQGLHQAMGHEESHLSEETQHWPMENPGCFLIREKAVFYLRNMYEFCC